MWPNSQCPADFVTFTEEILNGKLHFFFCGSVHIKNLLNVDQSGDSTKESSLDFQIQFFSEVRKEPEPSVG